MDVLSVQAPSQYEHLHIKTEKRCHWDDGYERKTSIHTPNVKADSLDSMEMIVQLAKKPVIQIYSVLKTK